MAEYLAHYGRKGMKWGKHIFGNDEPTILNDRLSDDSKLDILNAMKREADEVADTTKYKADQLRSEAVIAAKSKMREAVAGVFKMSIKSRDFRKAVESGKKWLQLSGEITKEKVHRLVGTAGYQMRKYFRDNERKRFNKRQATRREFLKEGMSQAKDSGSTWYGGSASVIGTL